MARGKVAFVDNHVDPATGTVALKAVFANDDRRLLPGQFVNVKLAQSSLKGVLTMPVNAVNQGPKGAYAYVIDAAGKAQIRPIVTSGVEDGIAVVAKGVNEGEAVVLDGQMTLRPGAKVFIAKPRTPVDGKAAH